MDEKVLNKALEIAAKDFHKHGIKMRGMEKYLTEKTTDKWVENHVKMWICEAKKEISKAA